jgi:NAD(P)H dehydrogenase (quinone)
MNCFVIHAHPEPQSFNGALFRAATEQLAADGHAVQTSDLYAMKFNPVSGRENFTTVKDPDFLKLQIEEMHATEHDGFAPDLQAELDKLFWCDVMIWQFPLWWFGAPAILKGWADRVLAMGKTYGGDRFYENGQFKGKRALLSVTTGGPAPAYEPGGFNGDIHGILRPIQRGILRFVGFDVLAPHIVYAPVRATPEQRAQWLAENRKRLGGIAKETPIDVGLFS